MKPGDLVQLLTPSYHKPIDGYVGIVMGYAQNGNVRVQWSKSSEYGGAWPFGRLKVLNESR
jgi:hypothetical protein